MALPRHIISTRLTPLSPLYDFLTPSLVNTSRTRQRFSTTPRSLSTTNVQGSNPQTPQSQSRSIPKPGLNTATNPATSNKPLTQAQRDFLTSALRVNQAGELAATLIYKAQTHPLVSAHPHLRPLIEHMYKQEDGHFKTFNSLLAKHRVRPTAMYPLWTFAASALGWTTAIMGREAAMACTEAVETEIGGHYNEQVRVMLDMIEGMEQRGEEVGEDLRELVDSIRTIRDEELEHLDHAVENDAQKAVPHELLTGVIRAGCKGAIWISEKV